MVAGEASGDRLGAALIKGLRRQIKKIEFQGVAGPEMKAHGIDSLFEMSELSVMGLAEILPKYIGLKRRLSQTVNAVLKFKPEILITIDSPDFCLRIAKAVRAADPTIRTVHYVAPTVWAWRPKRAKKIAKFIDHVLALFPFEPSYMEAEGMACDFVGHPVADMPEVVPKQVADFQESIGLDPNRPTVVVLPGSRRSEIQRLLPIFCDTLSHPDFANVQLIIPTLPHLAALVRDYIQFLPQDYRVVTGEGLSANDAAEQRFLAFSASTAALAASGTVSLELAAAGTPMVIAYDMGFLSRVIIGGMLRVDTVTLVNLISDTRDIPEFIGNHCKADLITSALLKLLADPHSQDRTMRKTMELLGRGNIGLADCAAKAVLARL